MSFRTVVIANKSRISYKNRYLVVKQDSDEKYIHLSEIDTIIVDTLTVSMTAYLLKELADNKINIIFCDDKHFPFGELIPYYTKHNTSKMIKEQINWSDEDKDKMWAKIVKNKILNQSLLLRKTNSNKFEYLMEYISEVVDGDTTNREGHAAKVYFNELFSTGFSRSLDNDINAALNYGYAILLSTITKEIVNNGYLTQVGLHHKNEFNEFNLSCDLMEPFRIVIDDFVYNNRNRKFDQDYKLELINIFNKYFEYKDKSYTLKDILRMYVKLTLDSVSTSDKFVEFVYYER